MAANCAPTANLIRSRNFVGRTRCLFACQVENLKKLMEPFLLRRLKSDVETKIPPKEETVIDVELTAVQKQYYRAIYERNTEFLMRGAKKNNAPNLMNVVMELRKVRLFDAGDGQPSFLCIDAPPVCHCRVSLSQVCNHPYLVKGVEDTVTEQTQDPAELARLFIASSGKFVLLDKLLPKLKAGGHRVLIFSQMVRILDLLSDFLKIRKFVHERLDGSIRGNDRQVRASQMSPSVVWPGKGCSVLFVLYVGLDFLDCCYAGGNRPVHKAFVRSVHYVVVDTCGWFGH